MSRRAAVSLLFVFAACTTDPQGGLAPGSPWPKFRGDAAQTGRARVHPSLGGKLWSFPTEKGIFSSPVVDADDNVFVGSADRYFYSLDVNGALRWKLQTGEIIDSSALLDDRGRVYFGSGDGNLRAVDAATGAVVWTRQADAPTGTALIRWFEGNVALSPSGELWAGNDNHTLYTVSRDDGSILHRNLLPDQIWSSTAFDERSGRAFVGNNKLVAALGSNLFAFDFAAQPRWDTYVGPGTVAASPLVDASRNLIVIGGFDGFIRGYDVVTSNVRWEVAARDHVYASAAQLGDGTIIAPAADGTVYAIDPDTGAVRWTFDTRTPIRSSPAVDADDNIYFGGGDGRLWVLKPDGTLRWAIHLIADDRNDLNASPALGHHAVYIAGEDGVVWSVPYDYCLGEGTSDVRCIAPVPASLPSDGTALLLVTPFGTTLSPGPAAIERDQPIVFTLVARNSGHDDLAMVDPSTVTVALAPSVEHDVEVSGDGKLIVITPHSPWTGATVLVHVSATVLGDLDRVGLRFSGGHAIGTATFDATLALPPPTMTSTVSVGTTFTVSRLALPLPTLMPSYNQIGFDSLHYQIGVVAKSGNHGLAWMVGARLDEKDQPVVDPTTRALIPLTYDLDGDSLVFSNQSGVTVEVMNAVIPLHTFRLSTALTTEKTTARVNGSTICSAIAFYGPFLQQLGLCNPTTDTLLVAGAANLSRLPETNPTPTTVEGVSFALSDGVLSATFAKPTLDPTAHAIALLVIDDATGVPVSLDYGLHTERITNADGKLTAVRLPVGDVTLPSTPRVYVVVDTTAIASVTL